MTLRLSSGFHMLHACIFPPPECPEIQDTLNMYIYDILKVSNFLLSDYNGSSSKFMQILEDPKVSNSKTPQVPSVFLIRNTQP